MGLDLYLKRVLKPSVCDEDNRCSYSYFKDECETVKKVAIIKNGIQQYYDIDKISKKFGLDKNSVGMGCFEANEEGEFYTFYDDNKNKVTLKSDELLKNYIISKKEKFYHYDTHEIAYQRKGLNDHGWDIIEKIGNCVNCDDKSLIQELVECGGLSEKFIDDWIDGETIFWAWW